jgi:hypothetical protein
MAPPLKNRSLIRIRQPEEGSMKRILCSLLVCSLAATLQFGSVTAAAPKSKNAKVTLVYQHELPNCPGKSIKGVLVEYGPGGYSPAHTHAKSAFRARYCGLNLQANRSAHWLHDEEGSTRAPSRCGFDSLGDERCFQSAT